MLNEGLMLKAFLLGSVRMTYKSVVKFQEGGRACPSPTSHTESRGYLSASARLQLRVRCAAVERARDCVCLNVLKETANTHLNPVRDAGELHGTSQNWRRPGLSSPY